MRKLVDVFPILLFDFSDDIKSFTPAHESLFKWNYSWRLEICQDWIELLLGHKSETDDAKHLRTAINWDCRRKRVNMFINVYSHLSLSHIYSIPAFTELPQVKQPHIEHTATKNEKVSKHETNFHFHDVGKCWKRSKENITTRLR